MSKFLDKTGLNYLWNKIKALISETVDTSIDDYKTQFESIQQESENTLSEAIQAKNEAQYYYNLIVEALESLDPDSSDVLYYSSRIVRQGHAIETIAQQLDSTYTDNSLSLNTAYTPGFMLKQIEPEVMEELIENDETEENTIYFVKEE